MTDETRRPEKRADEIESIPERELDANQADRVKGGLGDTTDATLSDRSADGADASIINAWPKKYTG